jgi:hypothetical protein
MKNDIQLEVPRYGNPFFDMALLADTPIKKLEKHFLEESIDGKIHIGQRLQDVIDIEEVKLLSISPSNSAENVCS